jgi:hypothetical protein
MGISNARSNTLLLFYFISILKIIKVSCGPVEYKLSSNAKKFKPKCT